KRVASPRHGTYRTAAHTLGHRAARRAVALVAAVCLGWASTAGAQGGGMPNIGPRVGAEIPDQTAVEGASFTLDVRGHFSDPNGDSLTYTATGLPPALSI